MNAFFIRIRCVNGVKSVARRTGSGTMRWVWRWNARLGSDTTLNVPHAFDYHSRFDVLPRKLKAVLFEVVPFPVRFLALHMSQRKYQRTLLSTYNETLARVADEGPNILSPDGLVCSAFVFLGQN